MHQELVSIFFQTELLFPSLSSFRPNKDKIRKLYNKMFEAGQHSYENLELQGERPTLSTKKEDGRSICQFGDNYIRIEEDQSGCNDDAFPDIVKTVLRGMGDDFPAFIFLQRSGLSGCKFFARKRLWHHPSPLMGFSSERASFIGVFSKRETLKICKISCNECSTFSSLRMMATST